MQNKRHLSPHSSKLRGAKEGGEKKKEKNFLERIEYDSNAARGAKGLLPAPGSATECRPPPMLSTIRACRIR